MIYTPNLVTGDLDSSGLGQWLGCSVPSCESFQSTSVTFFDLGVLYPPRSLV